MRVVKYDKRKDGIGDDNRLEGVRLKVKKKREQYIWICRLSTAKDEPQTPRVTKLLL